jgi:hypothetical protein
MLVSFFTNWFGNCSSFVCPVLVGFEQEIAKAKNKKVRRVLRVGRMWFILRGIDCAG